MNVIRPVAGVVFAILMCVPALAAEVVPLAPGGGFPIDKTEIVDSTPRSPSRTERSSSSSSSDYVEEPALQARHFGLQVALDCAVASQPNAIVVVNKSAEELPPGTRIKWQLKSEGQVGFFALLGPLAGGQTLVADNVLPGAAPQSAPCSARVL